MAVATESAACDSGVMVSVSGTAAEVISELSTAADIGVAYKLRRYTDIIASGGDATACMVMYVCRT